MLEDVECSFGPLGWSFCVLHFGNRQKGKMEDDRPLEYGHFGGFYARSLGKNNAFCRNWELNHWKSIANHKKQTRKLWLKQCGKSIPSHRMSLPDGDKSFPTFVLNNSCTFPMMVSWTSGWTDPPKSCPIDLQQSSPLFMGNSNLQYCCQCI